MPPFTQEELDDLVDIKASEQLSNEGIAHHRASTQGRGSDLNAETSIEGEGQSNSHEGQPGNVDKDESTDKQDIGESGSEIVDTVMKQSATPTEVTDTIDKTIVDLDQKTVEEGDTDISMHDATGIASESGDERAHTQQQGADDNSEDESDADSESVSSDVEDKHEEAESEEEDDRESEEDAISEHEMQGKSRKECEICDNEQFALLDGTNLTCIKCENHYHRACALECGYWEAGDPTDLWQCHNCSNASTSESPNDGRKEKAPRLPLISEGEDGIRSLRKRKSPTLEPPALEKRRRRATPKAQPASVEDVETFSHATRRASMKTGPIARVLQYRPPNKPPPHKFILAFRLDQTRIEKILSKPPRPGKRRRDRRRPPKIPPPLVYQPPVPKFPALPTNHLIFPSMWGDRENEINAKPYGGILVEADADTSRSLPLLKDREIFEVARKEAEEERRITSAAAEAEINGESLNSAKPSRTVSGPPSKIKCIQFGKHVIDTFYAAPYPEEYSHESRLFICEFCLKYLPSEFVAYRHKLKCPARHPPGDEIYRDGTISIWEVDGRKKTEYCQCLCLMAKMFLGSKTLYYDVEPFLFYILTEYDECGYHFVGYFSKEKRPASQNNVSCILVMPIHQRKGYATFLIDFSYLLTRIEGKDGSPEKPLSDMGLTAYRSYWDLTISRHLLANGASPISTKSLMLQTGMTADDVIHSLERLYAFVRDPVTKVYALRFDKQLYENIVNEFESKKHRILRPKNLVWTPYIMGRSDQAHLDGQPIQAIAPRDDDATAGRLEELSAQGNNFETELEVDGEALSPKSIKLTADPLLVNKTGHVAPGPPSTAALTGSTSVDIEPIQINGIANGPDEASVDVESAHLTGYALACHREKIPAIRFQIDPPIPPSMLRNRSNRRKTPGKVRVDTLLSPTTPIAIRSSPRHAGSLNGSINGSDIVSPEKPSTPMRRSSRKSGLAVVESVGSNGVLETGAQNMELDTKFGKRSDDEESSAASTDGDEEEGDAQTSTSEESDAADDDEVEVAEDDDGDEDDDDDEEEVEEDDEEDDEDDNGDPEVELDEDEDEEEESEDDDD